MRVSAVGLIDSAGTETGEGITYVIPWVILRDCSSPHHLLCHTHGPGKDHVVFFVHLLPSLLGTHSLVVSASATRNAKKTCSQVCRLPSIGPFDGKTS